MIIVDVESTGVDPRLCSLLSVGAVAFENPHNQFYMECRAFEGAHIEREALHISGFTLEDISTNSQPACAADGAAGRLPTTDNQRKMTDREVVEAFLKWMKTCKEWTLAGQNPSFDRDFLQETAHRYHINWPLAHRTVDLHSVAYGELFRAGREIPLKNNHSALNLDGILRLVGLPPRERGGHNALEDAKLETEAFARLLTGKGILSEYNRFAVPHGAAIA